MKRRSFTQSDQIRLQLQWLDEYASERPPLKDRIFSTGPIVPLAVCFMLGILSFDLFSNSNSELLFLMTPIAVSLILLALAIRARNSLRLNLIFAAACVLFFSLGSFRPASLQYQSPNHIRRLVRQDRVLATVQGIVKSPVYVNRPESIPWLGNQSSFYLEATRVHTESGWRPTSGTLRVQITGTVNTVQVGNHVQIYCWLSSFGPPANPGQFDIRSILKRRGVTVSASAPSTESLEVLEATASLRGKSRQFLRGLASNALLDETMTDGDVRALASALLLGERGDLNPITTSAFRKTGLAHFISLSGMHVGILAGSLWYMLRMTGLAKRPRAILCILILLVYAMIVPSRAATLRAVFLSCFFFGSVVIGRHVNPLNTLALSAMVLLFFRPGDLYSPGWQLSFACVLGILIFYKPVEYHLLSHVFYPILKWVNYRFVLFQRFSFFFIQMLSVGIAAWMFGTPIMAYHFGMINPLSPLWTVVTFGFVLLMLYGGFAKIALCAFLPTLASLLGLCLNWIGRSFEWVVLGLSKIDFVSISLPQISLLAIILFYIMIFILRYLPFRFLRLKKVTICLLLLIVTITFLYPAYKNRIDPCLELTCLSIGHGQAIILSTPKREHVLFDAGSITHQDIANKTIGPYLRDRAITSFEAAFLSHGDMDHINAVADTASVVDVKHVYANAALIETSQRPSIERKLVAYLDTMGLHVEPVRSFCLSGDVSIRTLWPDAKTSKAPAISENDKSQILLIEYVGRKILLCGDIEAYGQRQFINQNPSLDVDVLIMPHHGSRTNLDEQFVVKLSPEVVIASCSRRNAANAYHPPTDSDIEAFYTAIDGGITVKIKADGAISTIGFLSSQ